MRIEERWHMRSAHGPLQLITQAASTRCIAPRDLVAQQNPSDAAMGHVNRQRFRVVADDRPGLHSFHQPFRHQPFGKLALGIFIIEE
jgi:hypothetical protein